MTLAVYLIIMAGITYVIRSVPFTLVRGKVKSRYLRSFLYYVPYAVISAMTFPAVFYATGNIYTSLCGAGIALVLALFNCPLGIVSVASAAVAFAASFIIK